MQSFKINDHLSIVCSWKKTRNGFKHEASLLKDGQEIDSTKVCYLNRTWERYEYQTAMQKLLDRTDLITAEEKKAFIENPDNDRASKELHATAAIAALGDIFGKSQKEKNDWKERMLKAGLGNSGLIMPDDWDTLSEDEKERRLNGAIQSLQ